MEKLEDALYKKLESPTFRRIFNVREKVLLFMCLYYFIFYWTLDCTHYLLTRAMPDLNIDSFVWIAFTPGAILWGIVLMEINRRGCLSQHEVCSAAMLMLFNP